MIIVRTCSRVVRKLAWLILAATLANSTVHAKTEDTFPVLRTRTATYTNVTVTTKEKAYIFILHTNGMNSVKVTDLPDEIREQLGYVIPVDPALAQKDKSIFKTDGTNSMAVFARGLAGLSEKMKPLQEAWQGSIAQSDVQVPQPVIYAALVVVFAFYLFFCYCCHLICLKGKGSSNILVWVPIFQFIPLLQAAGMSGWWFLASFIPITEILWAVNIARSRGKTLWVSFFLLLPFTTPLAFLYLAFSRGPQRAPAPRYKSMSLATA